MWENLDQERPNEIANASFTYGDVQTHANQKKKKKVIDIHIYKLIYI